MTNAINPTSAAQLSTLAPSNKPATEQHEVHEQDHDSDDRNTVARSQQQQSTPRAEERGEAPAARDESNGPRGHNVDTHA